MSLDPQPLPRAQPFALGLVFIFICFSSLVASLAYAQEEPVSAQGSLPTLVIPWSSPSADAPAMSPVYPQGFLALINQNSPEEVEQALLRAEQLFLQNNASANIPPLAVVLHGPDVAIFLRENYAKYKNIVDLAAKLSALNVVDLSVCETRMGVLGRQKTELLPFVNTVPFGPAEERRLLNEKGYRHF